MSGFIGTRPTAMYIYSPPSMYLCHPSFRNFCILPLGAYPIIIDVVETMASNMETLMWSSDILLKVGGLTSNIDTLHQITTFLFKPFQMNLKAIMSLYVACTEGWESLWIILKTRCLQSTGTTACSWPVELSQRSVIPSFANGMSSSWRQGNSCVVSFYSGSFFWLAPMVA